MNWRIPENIDIRYIEGKDNDFNFFNTVGYPLQKNNYELKKYKSLRYSIKIEQSYPEYIELNIDQEDTSNLSQSDPKNYSKLFFNFWVNAKNLQFLPYSQIECKIIYQIFGKNKNIEELIEEKETKISLLKIGDSTKNILVDKDIYTISYSINPSEKDNNFEGDITLKIPNLNGKKPLFKIKETKSPIGFKIKHLNDNNFKIIKKSKIKKIYNKPVLEPYIYNVDLIIDNKIYDKFQIKIVILNSNENFLNSNYSLDYNFALDPIFIKIFKSNKNVDRVRMNLAMQFTYLDENRQYLNEVYEYMMIDDDIKIFPGEEIQDFFKKLQISNLEESEFISMPSTFSTVTPKSLFKTCITNIEIIEFDSNWSSYKKHKFTELKWLPGKKPKAFPYLTNGTLRRTYNNGIISLCAIQQDFIKEKLQKLASPLSNNINIQDKNNWIVQINFLREKANYNYGKYSIIKHKTIELEPMPEPNNVFSVIFENQNLCPDWFMFAEEYSIDTTLNHVMSQNLSSGRKFKANVTEEKKIILNTGWFFKEELPILEELMESGRCFVKTSEHGWLECVPISKKPLKYDSSRNLHQQIVEFEIVEK